MKPIRIKIDSKKVKGRDPFIQAMIQARVRSTITPTKQDRIKKMDRIQKQKGWA